MDFSNLVNQLKAKLLAQQPSRERSVYGLQDAYKQYALDAQLNGETPVPFADFVRQRRQPQQQPTAGMQEAAPGYSDFFYKAK